jgi:hypothetical protein
VTQLGAEPAGSELEEASNWDLDVVAHCITAAMQEIHETQPLVNQEKATGGYLHAPTAVTVGVTQGSAVIGSFPAWASWMAGCTVRVGGDDQDNELVSATLLARPYMGATGSQSGTVFGDCLTLPAGVQRAIAPICLPNQLPLLICNNLDEFLRMANWPALVNLDGTSTVSPFYWFVRKSIGRPSVAMAQGAYDSTLAYIPRRLRFAPLPDQAYPVSYRAVMGAPRYTRTDIVSGVETIQVTGAGDASANQIYSYLCELAGYRMYYGFSNPAYSIFFHPGLGKYILASTLTPYLPAPSARWESDDVTTPLGSFSPVGGASGTLESSTTDIGGGLADPGTIVPLVDDAVELILIPMALQRFSGTPSFKNEAAKPEIARQYKTARDKLLNSRALGASADAVYV